jgi:general L-amino acid transport system substrate-binding protein
MAYYFKAQQIDAVIQTFATRDEMLKAYGSGACDAYSGDQSSLFSDRASFAEPTKHTILPEIISKEPLGPLVLKADDEWVEIVRWTLAGLINAEEVGLGKASAAASDPLSDDAKRLVDGAAASGDKLRLSKSWLRDAVAAVGNYGEMFDADVGAASPLGMTRGINALWKSGGILYAPPMW